jgi:hypothetical protein
VIDAIANAIGGVPDVRVLDVQSDADHNRTVVTFVGGPEAVVQGAFQGIAAAAQLIDLDHHRGEHPRIGAADVVPLVPVRGVTMEDCVALARQLGQRVGEELDIPVYLYEEAATRPDRRNLADVRRGEYERLREEILTDPDRAPDFGPARLGPAGATVIGARPFQGTGASGGGQGAGVHEPNRFPPHPCPPSGGDDPPGGSSPRRVRRAQPVPLLIDGHNLIGSGQLPGISLADENDELKLVRLLRRYRSRVRSDITVVFDAGVPGGRSRGLSGGGVEAVFAPRRRQRADDVIAARVWRAANPGGLTVVTCLPRGDCARSHRCRRRK